MRLLGKPNKDQRGVSPVIGVILMVAITVVMAASIGTFMYGFGTPEKTPNVALTAKDDPKDSNSTLLQHKSGPTIAKDDWKYSVTEGKGSSTAFSNSTEELPLGATIEWEKPTGNSSSNITAGWYHVVVKYLPADSVLLDTDVEVR